MDLKQLEYFTAIADEGNVSAAARRLNLSQPPLSYQLKMLESELGVSLFRRGVRKMELTDAGRLLYGHATHLLNYSQSAAREVKKAGSRSVLRLGMSSSAVADLLPYLHEFSKLHPEARYELQDGNTFQLLDLLSQHVIEGSLIRTPVKLQKAGSITLAAEGMIAAWRPAADSPALACASGCLKTEPVTLRELAGRPLLLYRRYYGFILKAFRQQELEPDVFCLCDDARDILQWALEGMGTAVFPESLAGLCTGLYTAPVLSDALLTRVLFVWDSDTAPSPLLADLCGILTSHIAGEEMLRRPAICPPHTQPAPQR